MGEKIMYAVVLAAIAVLAFAVFAMPQGRQVWSVCPVLATSCTTRSRLHSRNKTH